MARALLAGTIQVDGLTAGAAVATLDRDSIVIVYVMSIEMYKVLGFDTLIRT